MKKRCAGTTVVLLFVAFGIGNAVDFNGVLNPNNKSVIIDSVVVVPPDTTFQTTGWQGQGTTYDTFGFPDLASWPTDLWIHGVVLDFPTTTHIVDPQVGWWYAFGFGTITPFVMFYNGAAVEGLRPAIEPRPRLAVSPSVVTRQMMVRLRPIGAGRPVVQIHDAVGNVVRSVDCTVGADGIATATWNRKDEFGRLVPEGVYFCRYAAADVIAVRKVLVTH
jgi:hypothetical protein